MALSALISELGDINKHLFKSQYYNNMHTTHSGEALLLSCLKRHGGNAKLYVELQAQMVNYMAEYKTSGGKD